MNLYALTTKITFIFTLAFISLAAFFIFYFQNVQHRVDKQVLTQYEKFAEYFHKNRMRPSAVETYLNSFGFDSKIDTRYILDHGRRAGEGRGYEGIEFQGSYYYHVQLPRYRKLYKDVTPYGTNSMEYGAFIFVLTLLILLYLWLLRSLHPLSTLKNNIIKVAEGDLSIDCSSVKKDEIAIVSNEFDNARQQINLLLESRQLFLRTVMHELKTPIAKGRIVSELVDDEVQKNRLIFLFEKLDMLINDFSKIEEIVAKNYTVNKYAYKVTLLVDNAQDMLLLEPNTDKISREKSKNIRIDVDFELMSMVIKNLIDNGIKYSDNGQVLIKEEETQLIVISEGKALDKPIEHYFKPFHNEANIQQQGMGLGLYIVKSVLDMHKMGFKYEYILGRNIFKIIY